MITFDHELYAVTDCIAKGNTLVVFLNFPGNPHLWSLSPHNIYTFAQFYNMHRK